MGKDQRRENIWPLELSMLEAVEYASLTQIIGDNCESK
jgi:hypothetical protein